MEAKKTYERNPTFVKFEDAVFDVNKCIQQIKYTPNVRNVYRATICLFSISYTELRSHIKFYFAGV